MNKSTSVDSHGSTRTKRIARISLFAALYVVANLIPVSVFIGGAGFITAGIIILPVIARFFRPIDAFLVAALSSAGLVLFHLSFTQVFGFYGLLIPVFAVLFGSLGYYKSYFFPIGFITFGLFWYLLLSGGTVIWVLPHLLAILLSIAVLVSRNKGRLAVVVHCLNSTMCELTMMTIGSISLLGLLGGIWTVIFPLMVFERSVAVLGSASLIVALNKVKVVK